MSSTMTRKLAARPGIDVTTLARIAKEGYGDGAWHGSDLKAALADVTPDLAYWRPGKGRHNIAEIALHHSYTVRSVRSRLTGGTPEAFPVEGEDWFTVDDKQTSWPKIVETVAMQQDRLNEAISGLHSATLADDVNPFDLVLGITCHAIYHAGQIQLIKVMNRG